MLQSVLKWYAIGAAVFAAQMAIALLVRHPPAAVRLPMTIALFFLGGCVIYFSGAESGKYVHAGSTDAPDLWTLFRTTWAMLVLFAPCWFLINSFFVSGLNVAGSQNIAALIVLWVATSMLAAPLIRLATNPSAFVAAQNAWHWLGYTAGIATLVCLALAETIGKK